MASIITEVRCSKLDMLFNCPPSVLAPTSMRISTASPDVQALGRIGSATHELCAGMVKGEVVNTPHVTEKYKLSSDELSQVIELFNYANKAWSHLQQFMPSPQVEKSGDFPVVIRPGDDKIILQVSGTLDCASIIKPPVKAICLDWKTGFIEGGHYNQMAGYAHTLGNLMQHGPPSIEEITVVIVYLRHRYYRVLKFNQERLDEWRTELKKNVMAQRETYKPGDYCRFCEIYQICKARRTVVEGTLDTMMFGDRNTTDAEYQKYLGAAKELLTRLTPDNKNEHIVREVVGDLLFRTRLAEQAVKDTKAMLREALERVGGIPLDEDRELGLRLIEREDVEPRKALPVLRALMSDGEICDAMKLSLPKLKKARASMAPGKLRQTSVNEMVQKLKDADALSVAKITRMEEMNLSTPNNKENKDGNSNSQPASAGGTTNGTGSAS